MFKWLAGVQRFLADESGPTAVEYAVMLALIIVVCIAAITTLGTNAASTFSNASLNAAAGQRLPELSTLGWDADGAGRCPPRWTGSEFSQSKGTVDEASSASTLVKFLKDESGPTAVEYAVMLALIIVVCITAITALGTNAANTFSYVGTNTGGVGS